MKPILVIGATGDVGREVVFQLVAAGTPVRAMTRNPDGAGLPPQVEMVRADLSRPGTLDACLDGAESVFLIWSAPPDAAVPALGRITHRARRVVFVSSPYKTAHPFFQQPNPVRKLHAQIEQAIEASGVEWTFIRPGMFAANALAWWAPQIRSGNIVRWPYASACTAPIHERDMAAVAVRCLCDDGHGGAEYVLTGPESLSQTEQVATIGRAIGRSLDMEEISPEEAYRELNMPAPVVEMLLSAWAAATGQPALVTSTVSEITGRPARTFFEWAVENAGTFRVSATCRRA